MHIKMGVQFCLKNTRSNESLRYIRMHIKMGVQFCLKNTRSNESLRYIRICIKAGFSLAYRILSQMNDCAISEFLLKRCSVWFKEYWVE